jgi:hypothetical protein
MLMQNADYKTNPQAYTIKKNGYQQIETIFRFLLEDMPLVLLKSNKRKAV